MNDRNGFIVVGLDLTNVIAAIVDLHVLDAQVRLVQVEAIVATHHDGAGRQHAIALLPQQDQRPEVLHATGESQRFADLDAEDLALSEDARPRSASVIAAR